ncbi:uncharacterized protein CLUP02_02800 [Colletotrichum lupini]|uniref:Uncharacterized protein n=1 Tax=Colletotrichum lupini TaxID=145971 RepID=A0A9Q8WC43_9PEZI|nr:uncharacterized protein CLUP02_02800 [Colletotrichum lupini]UQC77332.1 hypothetical protein CLUP02_02800 [Colletotrichum lupini]
MREDIATTQESRSFWISKVLPSRLICYGAATIPSMRAPYWGILFLVEEPNLTSHIEQIFLQASTSGGWSVEFPTYFMQGKQQSPGTRGCRATSRHEMLTAFKRPAAADTDGANVRIERAKLRQYDRGGQTGGQVTLTSHRWQKSREIEVGLRTITHRSRRADAAKPKTWLTTGMPSLPSPAMSRSLQVGGPTYYRTCRETMPYATATWWWGVILIRTFGITYSMSERRAKPVLDQPPPAYGIRECRGRSQAESVDTGQTRKSPGRQFHFVRLCARGPPRLGSWQPSIPPNFAPRRCGMRKFPLSSDRLRGSRIGLQSPDSRAFSSLQSILYSYGCFAQTQCGKKFATSLQMMLPNRRDPLGTSRVTRWCARLHMAVATTVGICAALHWGLSVIAVSVAFIF